MRFKIRIQFKKIILLLIIVIGIYAIYIGVEITSYAHEDQKTKADAAIILGAGVWGDSPSPVFEERIKHGIWLYKNGYVGKLIFTGGVGVNADYSESSIAKKYAIIHQVPEEDIFIEEESAITQENIQYAVQIVKANNMSIVIIVSDPLHMKRAMLIASDYGLNAYSSPTQTSKYKTLRSKVPFLAREIFYYMGYSVYRMLRF